jgi:transposase
VVVEGLNKQAADEMIDRLRVDHGVVTSRRGIARPRVHQQTSPESPFLDTAAVYYVYELVRPDTDTVFYVGKGSDRHQARIEDHIRKAKQGKKGHKYSIIRKLLASGLRPTERRVYENLCEADALRKEVGLVALHGLDKLANETDGGQTAPTGDNHWTRKHPEKVLRGETHPWATNPELAKQCTEAMQAALKADPTKRSRGERHGMSKLTEQQVHELRRRYQEDKALGKRLAIEFSITATQVSRILRGQGWGLPNLIDGHGNAKLTQEQINSILPRLAAGATQKDLATEWGVRPTAVNYHVSRLKNALSRPADRGSCRC